MESRRDKAAVGVIDNLNVFSLEAVKKNFSGGKNILVISIQEEKK